jgi:hypothetical protein
VILDVVSVEHQPTAYSGGLGKFEGDMHFWPRRVCRSGLKHTMTRNSRLCLVCKLAIANTQSAGR